MLYRDTSLCKSFFFLFFFFLILFCSSCSHTYSQIHTLPIVLSHTLLHTFTHSHKAPWGVVSAQMPPLPFSLSLARSLDSFSDMPAQAHLAAHALPLHFLSLPPSFSPFTFLPCGISMATRKETSVLGEQCDGIGCFG